MESGRTGGNHDLFEFVFRNGRFDFGLTWFGAGVIVDLNEGYLRQALRDTGQSIDINAASDVFATLAQKHTDDRFPRGLVCRWAGTIRGH
jgi:hypothetical protein